jgi:hypothetical protein
MSAPAPAAISAGTLQVLAATAAATVASPAGPSLVPGCPRAPPALPGAARARGSGGRPSPEGSDSAARFAPGSSSPSSAPPPLPAGGCPGAAGACLVQAPSAPARRDSERAAASPGAGAAAVEASAASRGRRRWRCAKRHPAAGQAAGGEGAWIQVRGGTYCWPRMRTKGGTLCARRRQNTTCRNASQEEAPASYGSSQAFVAGMHNCVAGAPLLYPPARPPAAACASSLLATQVALQPTHPHSTRRPAEGPPSRRAIFRGGGGGYRGGGVDGWTHAHTQEQANAPGGPAPTCVKAYVPHCTAPRSSQILTADAGDPCAPPPLRAHLPQQVPPGGVQRELIRLSPGSTKARPAGQGRAALQGGASLMPESWHARRRAAPRIIRSPCHTFNTRLPCRAPWPRQAHYTTRAQGKAPPAWPPSTKLTPPAGPQQSLSFSPRVGRQFDQRGHRVPDLVADLVPLIGRVVSVLQLDGVAAVHQGQAWVGVGGRSRGFVDAQTLPPRPTAMRAGPGPPIHARARAHPRPAAPRRRPLAPPRAARAARAAWRARRPRRRAGAGETSGPRPGADT